MDNKDLLLDGNFNLLTCQGDLVIGDATEQHLELLLISHPGDFKQYPTTGIGIDNFLKSPMDHITKGKFYRLMSIQFEDNNLHNVIAKGNLSNLKIQP